MQGDKKVIAYLNAQLKMELTAVNQYFLHYRMLQELGFRTPGQVRARRVHRRDEARRQDHRARADARRPAQPAGPGQAADWRDGGGNAQCDLKAELGGQTHLKDAIDYCESVRDYVSRELFEEILTDTEHHVDHLETQLELVDKVGEQNYLQSQMTASSLTSTLRPSAYADRHPLADCAQQFIGDGAGALRHGLDRQFRSPQHGGVADCAHRVASVTSTPIMSIDTRPASGNALAVDQYGRTRQQGCATVRRRSLLRQSRFANRGARAMQRHSPRSRHATRSRRLITVETRRMAGTSPSAAPVSPANGATP